MQITTRRRVIYGIIIPVVIGAGLLARLKKEWFPDIVNLGLGDALYAVMVYFVVSFLLPQRRVMHKAVIALIFCYLIEISQLYHAEWIDAVRDTIFGRLVLGSGFLWSDILAYFIGVVFAAVMDKFCFPLHSEST